MTASSSSDRVNGFGTISGRSHLCFWLDQDSSLSILLSCSLKSVSKRSLSGTSLEFCKQLQDRKYSQAPPGSPPWLLSSRPPPLPGNRCCQPGSYHHHHHQHNLQLVHHHQKCDDVAIISTIFNIMIALTSQLSILPPTTWISHWSKACSFPRQLTFELWSLIIHITNKHTKRKETSWSPISWPPLKEVTAPPLGKPSCLEKETKVSQKLDPVGSTVRYEMIKLCTGSV